MIDQSDSGFLFDKAVDFQNRGLYQEALALWDRLLGRAPVYPQIHYHRARALISLKRLEDALQSLDLALALRPDDAEYLRQKALTLQTLGNPDAALQTYAHALRIAPDHVLTHYNQGTAFHALGRFEDAISSYDRAIRLQPQFGAAHNNRGDALRELKRLPEALESFDRLLALHPGQAVVMHNKAICNLMMGRFEDGWAQYESRKTLLAPLDSPAPDRPFWLGKEDLRGKSLLIHCEAGFGDTIQFCRYALLMLDKNTRVILSAPRALMRLLKTLSPQVQVVDAGVPAPDCDYQILLMSLPGALATRAENIPAPIPYLQAEPERMRHWANTIGRTGFRIGIAWQGDPLSRAEKGRSFALRQFAGLAALSGVRLISLQKNQGSEQLADLPPGMVVESLGADFDGASDAFLDTAAVMEDLDLVITPDTAVAHVAGALGRPVWVALKQVPDWRWMLDASDTPWYPSMRLFRQDSNGDWNGVFGKIESALRDLLATPDQAGAPTPKVAVSWGELLDKMTILEIKREKIADPTAQANVVRELSQLQELAGPVLAAERDIEILVDELRAVNRHLWNIEAQLRDKEAARAFDAEFVALARSVYFRNDARGALKKKINLQLASEFVEEKYYSGA